MSLDHGGNLDAAIGRFGGAKPDWIDLSTGINRQAYPLPDLAPEIWQALPDKSLFGHAITAARAAYGTDAPCLPVAGAQAAIQLIPTLRQPGTVRILRPTYNEHAACFAHHGWHVETVPDVAALRGADAVVIVNPNNPDGRSIDPAQILDLAKTAGLVIVDESFADPTPDLSVCSHLGAPNLLALRSLGKFYGLAGLRLGFVLGAPDLIDALSARAGPWAVNGPALAIGAKALADTAWQNATIARLSDDTRRLDAWTARQGWSAHGGTSLFRLYETPNAADAQTALARHHIWSRIFPYSDTWLRLGLPGGEAEWSRLDAIT